MDDLALRCTGSLCRQRMLLAQATTHNSETESAAFVGRERSDAENRPQAAIRATQPESAIMLRARRLRQLPPPVRRSTPYALNPAWWHPAQPLMQDRARPARFILDNYVCWLGARKLLAL